MGKNKSPDKPDKNGIKSEAESRAEAGAFLAKIVGETKLGDQQAIACLEEEIDKRRVYVSVLNTQIELIERFRDVFVEYQGIRKDELPNIETRPLTAMYKFSDDDSAGDLN